MIPRPAHPLSWAGGSFSHFDLGAANVTERSQLTLPSVLVLLWIHRPFLSMALLQHPDNPFESMYSQSVLAAQNSASFIIRTTARYLEKAPESILRHWDVWVDVSSAAVSITLSFLRV